MTAVRIDEQALPRGPGLLALYSSVGWNAYTAEPDRLDRAIAGSSRVVTAWSGDDLVGLARVVSDGETICYLQDLLVRPDHQRQGLGRRLADVVLAPYSQVRQKVLLTDDAEEQRRLYASLGFTEVRDVGEGTLRAFVRFDTSAHPGPI